MQGLVFEVSITPQGDETMVFALGGASSVVVGDISDFDEDGGELSINDVVYPYTIVDEESGIITLGVPLEDDVDAQTPVYVYPFQEEKWAMVVVQDVDDAILARVPHSLYDRIPDGVRDEAKRESVVLVMEDNDWVLDDVIARYPWVDGSYMDPGTILVPTPPTVPPELSPIVRAWGGINRLYVEWDPVVNTSDFDVDIYVSDISGFTLDSSTFYKSAQGTFTTIEHLPDGSVLQPDTTYYIRVVARNDAGSATPSPEVSAQRRKITEGDISVDTAWVGTMNVDRLVGGTMNANAVLVGDGGVRAVGAGGESVKITSTGFLVSGPTALGNPDYVSFPTDGRPNIISGVLQAATLTVEGDATTGQAATFRGNSQIEPGATLNLNDSIVAPVSGPLVQVAAPPLNNGGFGGFSDYDPSDNSLCHIGGLPDVYFTSLDLNTEAFTISTNPVTYNGNNYAAAGFTRIGTAWYILWRNGNNLYLGKYARSGVNLVQNGSLALGTPTGGQATETRVLGNDGTYLWIGLRDGTSNAVRFHRYLADLSTATRQETVTTTFAITNTADEFNAELSSLIVGNMDFGARKFVLTYGNAVSGGNSGTGRPLPDLSNTNMAVFGTTGTRETNNEFDLVKPVVNGNFWVAQSYLLWKGSDNNDSTGQFMESGDNVDGHYLFTKFKLSGRTASLYIGSSYYRSSDGNETPSSPQTTLIMKSRQRWKATVTAAPAGLVSRVYAGLIAGAANSRLQVTLGAGVITTTRDTYDSGGATPPTISSFGTITPAMIQSQATVNRVFSTTTVSGSRTLTGAGFKNYLVGREVTGAGIPTGTRVLSVESTTSLTLTANATDASTANRTFIVPRIEIRGDGYARIIEMEGVILSSTADVNVLAGNIPPLRIGDIGAVHMRIDGNELQGMTDDDTPGGLTLNQGGGNINMNGADQVSMGGKTLIAWNWGSTTIMTNASGEDTISHGLGGTPGVVLVTVGTTGSIAYKVAVTAWGTTTFTVEVRRTDTNALAPNGTSVQVRWIGIR